MHVFLLSMSYKVLYCLKFLFFFEAVVSSNDVQADDSSCLLPEQTAPNGHVTFPNHFKVPEALKTGLTFGSFDTNSGLGTEFGNSNGCGISGIHAIESSCGNDETAREPSRLVIFILCLTWLKFYVEYLSDLWPDSFAIYTVQGLPVLT